MSKLYISEFNGLAATDQSDSVDIFPPSALDQAVVTVSGTAAPSAAFAALTQFIEFVCDGIMSFVIGFADATATGSIGATAASGVSLVNVLTLTGVTGYVSNGDTASDGTNSTTVGAQISGTPGGDGTYACSIASPGELSGACTITSNVVNVTANISAPIHVGAAVSGSGVTGATVKSGPANGNAGQYVIDGSPQQHAAETLTFKSTVATTSNMRVAAGERMRRKVLPGQCISAITNT